MYLALYRKYRPRTFDEVISQEHITTTLKNQVLNGSAGHAYLFTGSRGTGKTSCAKILAMAVNCENPQNGNPCLECERCREILNGTTTDIVEMDAASNNGVDDVRQLRDEVAYTPVSCKYRVYIIDEVHMLSTPAFNALLKTLEEPPSHVKFILATTELHKVPATISSRCQRFEFRRVNAADSTERLLEVAAKEGVQLERGAAELIARLSDGGMRDALSILDRCISAEGSITPQTVRDCAGVADDAHLFALSEMIARHDTAGCIRLLGELHKGSKDIALIIDELSGHFRDMMLYKTAPNDRDLLSVLPDEQEKLFAIADEYSLGDILRCLTLLQQCADGIGKIKQRKTLAEMCFVKMCTGEDVRTDTPRAAAAPKPSGVQYREIPDEKPAVQRKPESEMTDSERARAIMAKAALRETAKLAESAADIPDKNTQAAAPKTEPEAVKQEPTSVKQEPSLPKQEPTALKQEQAPPKQEQASPKQDKPPVKQAPAVETQYDYAPPPELNAPPASYFDNFVPPPPDEAPPENDFYGAREYQPANFTESTAPEVQRKKNEKPKTDTAEVRHKEPEAKTDKAAEVHEERKPVIIDKESAEKIAVLTQEQWEDAISRTDDFIVAGMLKGSVIKAEGDTLVISSSNKMLLTNIKGKEIPPFEKKVSAALGFSVHIKIVPNTSEPDEEPSSPLEKFLAKSRDHGIAVTIKD